MRKFTTLIAVCALAACGSPDTVEQDTGLADAESVSVDGIEPATDAGFEAVAEGNYEIVRGDGVVDQLTILPGLTWAMVSADGTASGGTIFAQDGQQCFVTEGVEGHQCFTGSEPAEDGSMQVTGAGGEVATIRPVDAFQ